MNIDRHTLLFFDAACLIAASGSPSGGSGFLLSLCSRSYLRGAVSLPVLLEAERNIQLKMGPESMETFNQLLLLTPLLLAALPPAAQLRELHRIVGEKDAHVLGACLAVRADFLVTLDKRLEANVNKAGLAVQAITPGEFIKTMLPRHIDYPGAR